MKQILRKRDNVARPEQLFLIILLLLASERSERDTYRGKNEKIGDVCLLASERSERDSIRGG